MRYKIFPVLAWALLLLSACSDWKDVELSNPIDLTGNVNPSDYYENLKTYRNSDHTIGFGWFGGWNGEGASMKTQLMGLPDSVDVVSIWGGAFDLTEAKKADLKLAQEKKGLKVLVCFIVSDIGDQLTPAGQTPADFWKFKAGDEAGMKQAVANYANAICDTIDKYGYDGFDFDFEPHYGHNGNIASSAALTTTFIETLGKRIGPKSGTGRILVVDGEPQSLPAATGEYFNYFIVQAYDCSGDTDLDNRLRRTIANFNGVLDPVDVAKRYVVTENFEKYPTVGGADFTDRYGNRMKSLEGMARWSPIINGQLVRKGGIGTYHMEYEYTVSGYANTYPYLRQGIRLMNPPAK